jgi:SAM-dependent methyltransferase
MARIWPRRQSASSAGGLRALLPAPPSTNYHLKQFDLDPYELLPKEAVVLDIGSGGSHGHYAFVKQPQTLKQLRYIGLDLDVADGDNVRAEATQLPLKADSVDFVTCVSALEYIRYPQKVVEEAFRVLKPGGLIYLSAPFVFPFHPPPDDLFRFSFQGLRLLAREFEEIKAGSNRGPASTFCHLSVHFFAILLSFNSRRVYGAWLYLFTWGLAWLKFLDRWIGRYSMASVMFGNAFFLGRKPAGEGSNCQKRPHPRRSRV